MPVMNRSHHWLALDGLLCVLFPSNSALWVLCTLAFLQGYTIFCLPSDWPSCFKVLLRFPAMVLEYFLFWTFLCISCSNSPTLTQEMLFHHWFIVSGGWGKILQSKTREHSRTKFGNLGTRFHWISLVHEYLNICTGALCSKCGGSNHTIIQWTIIWYPWLMSFLNFIWSHC